MRCCDSGKKCHCGLTNSNCQSGSGCCDTTKKSVKCLIRRLVSYFKSLGPNPSNPDFSKKCCDLLCVAKTCEFLWSSLKNTKTGPGQKFYDALETLKYSSPCGHDLWRTLDDFLYYCVNMVGAHVQSISGKLKGNCSKCGKPGKSGTSPCDCNNKCNGSDCKPCDVLLEDSHLMAILTRKFSSSYDSSNAKWDSLCKFGSKCCGNPSCSQCQNCSPGSSLCPSKCCEKCPKRLCAKIFLGFLPCMYWGLKILYDRAQAPLTWPDWHDFQFGSYSAPSSDLGRFLYAWGYHVLPLKNKKGFEFSCMFENLFGSDILKKLYENCKKIFYILLFPFPFPFHFRSFPSQDRPFHAPLALRFTFPETFF
ncbi:variant erythrocyte surface antigen-1, alpha subunit [Babesia divergens]|uniref:Variant erythrocyte surface antigen-1, alpha subunit n=1 Tax=Babesia divergens TaxID=32595 RepID=A0AAD9GCW8_BABDI|nr:variant erythrocyte surface antigen-1, alpha subunit [Babesia divergens]